MQIKQSEVFDKVLVTESCVFVTRRGTVTDFWFFGGLKNICQEQNHTTLLGLPQAMSGKNMKNFDFSSCAKYFRYGSVLVDTVPSVLKDLFGRKYDAVFRKRSSSRSLHCSFQNIGLSLVSKIAALGSRLDKVYRVKPGGHIPLTYLRRSRRCNWQRSAICLQWVPRASAMDRQLPQICAKCKSNWCNFQPFTCRSGSNRLILFYFYFNSFAQKNTENSTKQNKKKKKHWRYTNTSNKNVTIH